MIEQDEVLRMARECLIYPSTITDDNGTGMYATFEVYKASIESLQRFAALAAAHEAEKWKADNKRDYENWKMAAEKSAECEREACAKTCEEEAEEWSGRTEPHEAVVRCAAAIRGRGMDLLTQHSQSIGEYDER